MNCYVYICTCAAGTNLQSLLADSLSTNSHLENFASNNSHEENSALDDSRLENVVVF